jgi:serine/threonine protein kinase
MHDRVNRVLYITHPHPWTSRNGDEQWKTRGGLILWMLYALLHMEPYPTNQGWELPFSFPLKFLNPTTIAIENTNETSSLRRLSKPSFGIPTTLTLPYSHFLRLSSRYMIGHLAHILPVFIKFGHPPEMSNEALAYSKLTSLQGKSIPVFLGIFSWSKFNFIITSFVTGRNPQHLTELTQSQKQELLSIVASVHDHGIQHCDIDARNVIVRPNGRVFLVDFGVSEVHHCDGPTSCKEVLELKKKWMLVSTSTFQRHLGMLS